MCFTAFTHSVTCSIFLDIRFIVKELLNTERIYIHDLEICIQCYRAALFDDEVTTPEGVTFKPPNASNELRTRRETIFLNLVEIFNFHKSSFSRELAKYESLPENVGHCFVTYAPQFIKMYVEYCKNMPESTQTIVNYGQQYFEEIQRRSGLTETLASYLIKPVQRITKYQLMLKDLLSCVQEFGKDEIKVRDRVLSFILSS
jgi:hypothetical protein